jgi:CubicO group peptidase (beta-lactamase class C family)
MLARAPATRRLLLGVVVVALSVPAASRTARASGHSNPGETSSAASCRGARIFTEDGCVSASQARGKVLALVHDVVTANDLAATIVRVNLGARTLVTTALGHSMAGVAATPRMHWRIGSIAIAYLTTIALQLEDEGRLSLDDTLATWFPALPNADRITLRMLANSTSGYRDYVQGNPEFADLLLANPFRQWTQDELIAYALARPLACQPGECFTYSHANFIILGNVLATVTRQPVATLMRRRILRPLGMRNTHISDLPAIPPPALHAYSADRHVYEDSTFWSPSWTIGRGVIMTSNVHDVIAGAMAVGSGRLLSRRAARAQVAPDTVGLPGIAAAFYYGLGINVAPPWRFQNPVLNGYSGIMAYLPDRRLAIAIVATTGPESPLVESFSVVLFRRLAAYLAPEHALPPSG